MFIFNLIRNGLSASEIIMLVLALVIAAYFSIVIHEISHGYVALKCGDTTAKLSNRLTLNPLAHIDPIGLIMILLVGFGWAKPVPIDPRNFKNYKCDMFLVSIAGVTSNILMCGIGLLLLHILYPVFIINKGEIIYLLQLLGYYLLIFGITINFMQAFFNLLPIYPLDGFRIVNLALKPGNAYSSFMYRYGSYCILALVIIGNVFRAVNLQKFDVFYWANWLINTLIGLVK